MKCFRLKGVEKIASRDLKRKGEADWSLRLPRQSRFQCPRLPPSIRVPSSPSLSAQLPPAGSTFGKTYIQLQAPGLTQRDYDHLTHDEFHQLCRRRGYAGKASKAVLKTRLSTMDSVARTRDREKEGAMDSSEDMPVTQEKRCRVECPHSALAVDKEIVKKRAQWGRVGARPRPLRARTRMLSVVPGRRISQIKHCVQNRALPRKRRMSRWRKLPKVANWGRGRDPRSSNRQASAPCPRL